MFDEQLKDLDLGTVLCSVAVLGIVMHIVGALFRTSFKTFKVPDIVLIAALVPILGTSVWLFGYGCIKAYDSTDPRYQLITGIASICMAIASIIVAIIALCKFSDWLRERD